jgi:hypothetical protein
MSVKDWFGKNKLGKHKAWDIVDIDASVPAALFFAPAPGKNRFKLKPTIKEKKVVYFSVVPKPGALPAMWKKVRLFPRGNTLPPQPAPALSAPPTSIELITARGAVKNHLAAHGSSTERLEGEIDVNSNGGKERLSLTFVQIPKAVGGNEALLCLFVTGDAKRLDGSPNPDGTAGGGSVHP